MKKREYNFYDSDHYKDFGLQPDMFEIQIGYGLIPLVDEEKHAPLLKEIKKGRNQFDAEYGIPIPPVRIVDNMKLDPCEYAISFNGVEVDRWELKPYKILCVDTGDVVKIIEGNFEKTKDPAFGADAVFVPDEQEVQFKKAGYACVKPGKVISVHLFQIAYQNRTKILNQCMVNTLVDKVRPTNPDVISDLFFKKGFTTSKLKAVLNFLLAEDVSIRDMNTILETIADYIEVVTPAPIKIAEQIRENLALSILSKYADKNKNIHGILVNEKISEKLYDHMTFSTTENMPYFALDKDMDELITEKISNYADKMREKDFAPLFIAPKEIRTAFAKFLQSRFYDCKAISCNEITAVKNKFCFNQEGELDWNE